MTSSRFFRAVWRVNGVLVLATFLLVAFAAIAALVSSLPWGRAARPTEPVAARTAEGEPLELGDVVDVTGTSFVLLPFATRGSHGKFSSGETSTTRNLLFFDTASAKWRWLRPDHLGVIGRWDFIHAPGSPGQEDDRPVRYIRYELATSDTDGDGKIGPGDHEVVAVSGPGGEELATVIPDADVVLGYRELEGDALLVFIGRGLDQVVVHLDLPSRKVIRETKLPRS